MDRLAEMDEYDSMFGRRLVDDDFLAAGYTPQEVQAYRGSIVQPSLTAQDRAAMEARYGTLQAPDPTLRQRGAARVQDRLISAGLDPYMAGSYSRRILGDTAPTDGGLGIGLADFTPLGAIFGVQEGSRTAVQGYQQGDPLQMGLGALEAGLNIVGAAPLSATIGRGIAETASRMDPNTLYSVFGPPVGNTSPLRAPETGGGSGQRLYRVEREIYENPGEGAVYYSPDRQYVENYNSPDRVLRQASIPENIIDTTTQGGRASVRSWLESELGRYKQRAESGEIRGGPDLRDLDRILAKDELSFEETSRALALLDVLDSSAIGRIPVGASQRRFMDDVGVDAMTMRESDGSLSYAFRSPETARSYQISDDVGQPPLTFDEVDRAMRDAPQASSGFDVTRRDASNIFGEGTERVRYTDPQSGGTIEVVTRPDGSASVLELEVPEEFRGQGIGQRLQERVMQDFPEMGGQVSSKAAATTAYRLGRRPPGQPDATLDDVFAIIDEMSSVNLVSPEMQSRIASQ